MNELDKGTQEKTRIFGTIRNSKNRDPVKDASITLSIEGTQIASITSDELGGYEYTAEEDYTGQTLDYVIQKEGFMRKDISHEIDRFEIESNFLMDEIEIKINGKICDETDSPLDNASISFSIGGSTIELVSDKDGAFSFTVGQQFLNQSIGYEVNKEGFKIKSGKLKLLENLKCINISKSIPPIVPDKSKWIKNAVVGIGLVGLTVLVIYLFGLAGGPELSIDPDAIDFDFEPGTGAQTFSIRNNGDGTLEWNVYSDRDWIIVSPDCGTDSGTVSVSVNSAGMDPGMHTAIITVESNGGYKTGTISLYIPPIPEPTGEPTVEPTSGPSIIHYFRANPEYIDGLEGETTLSWEVSDATSVTIDGIPVEVSKGSIDRWVEQTTTFILRATNEAGISDVRDTTVYVIGETVDSPVIHHFIADPESISPGEKSTLRWDVSGVEMVTINNGIGEMGGIGNTDVFLDETTIFILTAENDAGKDTEPVTVEVLEPKLLVDPSPLSLNFKIWGKYVEADCTKTFTIRNSGEGNLHWFIKTYDLSKTKRIWITVDPDEGDIKANNEETITIKIKTTGLKSGDYNGEIFIDSNGGTVIGDIYLDLFKSPLVTQTVSQSTPIKRINN